MSKKHKPKEHKHTRIDVKCNTLPHMEAQLSQHLIYFPMSLPPPDFCMHLYFKTWTSEPNESLCIPSILFMHYLNNINKVDGCFVVSRYSYSCL